MHKSRNKKNSRRQALFRVRFNLKAGWYIVYIRGVKGGGGGRSGQATYLPTGQAGKVCFNDRNTVSSFMKACFSWS